MLDGRDIGTVICPDAEVKLFVTADEATRAHRRWLELRPADPALTEADVLADLAGARRPRRGRAMRPDAARRGRARSSTPPS